MRYTRNQAKDYAHQHLKGIWAAAPTVFTADLALDLPAFARNIQHWIVDLEIDGVFVGGKQGEYFSMLLSERKQLFDIAVATAETLGRPAGVMLSCSDQNLDATLDLAMHAQAVGAEYIVIHSPALPFGKDIDSTVHEYYRYISERLDIAIAMWNHPDCGYVMSPQLCARIAGQCPNIVAIKYSVARDLYVELTRLTAGTLIVSSALIPSSVRLRTTWPVNESPAKPKVSEPLVLRSSHEPEILVEVKDITKLPLACAQSTLWTPCVTNWHGPSAVTLASRSIKPVAFQRMVLIWMFGACE